MIYAGAIDQSLYQYASQPIYLSVNQATRQSGNQSVGLHIRGERRSIRLCVSCAQGGRSAHLEGGDVCGARGNNGLSAAVLTVLVVVLQGNVPERYALCARLGDGSVHSPSSCLLPPASYLLPTASSASSPLLLLTIPTTY